MSPSRLETFADGVFAIAATLLILTVDGAVGGEGIDLGAELRHAWPAYVGYVVSFVTIGIMWMNHHTVMSLVERVDRRFLLANLGLLMCIAFVPFPTRLMAEHIRGEGAESAALAYGFTLTATAVFFNTVWLYASTRRPAAPRRLRSASRSPASPAPTCPARGSTSAPLWSRSPARPRAPCSTSRSPRSTSSRARCSAVGKRPRD